MSIKSILTIGICACLLTGCTLGPNYNAPFFAFGEKTWADGGTDQASYILNAKIEQNWWQNLNDPTLNALVDEAVNANLDIKIAKKNLERADALLSQSRSGLFPRVDAQGGMTRRKLSENSGIPTGPQNPRIQDFYDAGLVSNWEIDIFGGTRREIAASYARFESLVERTRDTLLIVLSEVARNYIELRGAQQRSLVIENNIALQDKTVALVKRRFDVGDASDFDYSRALAQLQATKARLPNISGQINTLIYRLSVLTGQPPEALLADLSPVQDMPVNPDIVKVGLRSELLQRRPDVRAAERNLAAEINDIGARVADLFPKFTLTGSVGFESIGTSDFISSSSETWRIGPGISWPIFSAGLIRAQIDAEEAEADAAIFEYEKTVLLALEDAETALVQYGRELEARAQLQSVVNTRAKNIRLAKKRYESGLDSLTNLIDTEREALNSEEELIASETALLLKLTRLYKSLGGGWNENES